MNDFKPDPNRDTVPGRAPAAAPLGAVEVPQRIDQTVLGEKGNCFSACLAMMLGLPPSEVPNFCEAPGFDEDPGPAFMKAAHEWLAARGWGHITMDAPNMLFRRHYSRGYIIAAGMTSRGRLHSVIYKDGQLWHDPHPSHEGIQEVLEVDLIYPLQPFARAALSSVPVADKPEAVVNVAQIRRVIAEMREEPDNGQPGDVPGEDVAEWVTQLEDALGDYNKPAVPVAPTRLENLARDFCAAYDKGVLDLPLARHLFNEAINHPAAVPVDPTPQDQAAGKVAYARDNSPKNADGHGNSAENGGRQGVIAHVAAQGPAPQAAPGREKEIREAIRAYTLNWSRWEGCRNQENLSTYAKWTEEAREKLVALALSAPSPVSAPLNITEKQAIGYLGLRDGSWRIDIKDGHIDMIQTAAPVSAPAAEPLAWAVKNKGVADIWETFPAEKYARAELIRSLRDGTLGGSVEDWEVFPIYRGT